MTMTTRVSHSAVSAALVFSLTSVGARERGQTPPPAPNQAQQDIQIKTTRFGSNFYAIDGQGGRMGALVGPDGVFLVDSQFAATTEKIVGAIRQLSDRPIRFLVNTHVHGDHTGGNENFGKMGVTIFARTQVRARLARPSPLAAGGPRPAPAPAAALPAVTYDERVTIHMNGEDIQLIPLSPANTDGDTAVRFPVADVLMTGDVFRSVGYPNIDRANGGSLKIVDALSTLIDLTGPNTTVIPGHGPITNRAAIVAYRDIVITIRDRVSKLISEGRTLDQIVAGKPTADQDERTGNAVNADRFVQQVYAELRGTR